MDPAERAALIRKGNELFNQGNFDAAEKIFVKTGYRDGLTRLADHLFYEKHQPLFALRYYKMVNHKERVNEIFERMIFALGKLLGKKSPETPMEEQEIEVKVHPKLKILAEEILRDQEEKENQK